MDSSADGVDAGRHVVLALIDQIASGYGLVCVNPCLVEPVASD